MNDCIEDAMLHGSEKDRSSALKSFDEHCKDAKGPDRIGDWDSDYVFPKYPGAKLE